MDEQEITTPDFSNSVDVMDTDSGQAVSAIDIPDFSNSVDVVDAPVPIQRQSIISKIARAIVKQTPIEQFKTALYFATNDKIPDRMAGENYFDYNERINQSLQSREDEIIGEGIGKVLESPIQVGIGVGLVTAAIPTVIAVGAFSVIDKFINLRRYTEHNFPDTAPELLDVIEIGDFLAKGGVIGGGIVKGKVAIRKGFGNLGIPKNVNISSEQVGKIKDSVNLLPEEKVDLMKTLGVKEKHLNASVNSDLPLNVPSEKIYELAEKPYWERTKEELGIVAQPEVKAKLSPKREGATVEGKIDKQPILENIKKIQEAKDISGITLSKLKKFVGIDNIKKADTVQLQRLENYLSQLRKGDKFLSDKTLAGLKDIVKELPSPEVTPKRIIISKFGEKSDIMEGLIVGKIDPKLIPTVDIKEGHPLVKKIVEEARVKLDKARNEVDRRNEKLDKMLTKAEKSRINKLSPQEKISRVLLPQNKEIFEALGGKKVDLTKDEVATVAYLKNFFAMVKEDLALEKSRKNYVTHLEQSLTEKVLTKGIPGATKQILSEQKKGDIPIDIMLELENIIGSEKFFRFALERKGGIEPSTNIRQIVNTYSNLFETKKALDSILPEGQAITKNLLQGQTALWMKNFLQNLKGRGLDNGFRTGRMGWLAKVADGIIDIGYIKLLGLNWKSALKNLIAGETNSWIYQDFPTYLEGKKRFSSNPKKAYKLAKEYGILEGTFADYAEKGIGKLKKLQDFMMIGQKGGEFEIRSSIFSGMLTEKEWKSGKVSLEHIQEIKNTVAITQGVFSKVDSPLWLQTWYGRMFFQMNRWRITNTMLLRRLSIDASKDIKAGNYRTQNTARLGKMLVAYGVGMYISNELQKAGYKKAGDVARNIAQTIDGVTSLVTEGNLIKMFTENPTLQTLKEVGNTVQDFAHYLYVPGAEKARGKGIEDTYIAPIQGIEDIMKEIE